MGRGPGVRAVGEEAIQIDFRYRGERCRERVRLASSKANLAFCRQWKARIEHEIATQTFDYAKHFPESARARKFSSSSDLGLPLLQAMRAHCDTLEGQVEPETLRDYRNDAETVAAWFDASTTTRTLTRKQIREALALPRNVALSRVRLTNMMKPLRGALADLEEDDAKYRSPFTGFTWRRIEAPREEEDIDPFSPEEIAALGATSEGDLWTFWAWTGLRTGELIGLRARAVGPDCSWIEIRHAVRRGRTKAPKTKAGRRRITLLQPARAALRNALRGRGELQPDDPIFMNPRKGRDWHNAQALSRAFARACKAANVRYRYPYQHRHTFATWALSSGENPLWVAKVLGHKDVAVLYKHYGRWMAQLDSQAGKRMVSKAHRGQAAA